MKIKDFRKYLEQKNLAPISIESRIERVQTFFQWVKKEDIQVTKPDVLRFLEYLKSRRGQQNKTRATCLSALNHYFTFLLKNEFISKNPCAFIKIRGTRKKQLHKIYTTEELEQLFDNFYNVFIRTFDNSRQRGDYQKELTALIRERNVLILNILINQGVVTSEIENIEIDDIDFIKATIKIRSTRKRNERILPLKATQIGFFINYLQKIRPQLIDLQNNSNNKKLFIATDRHNPKAAEKGKFKSVCDILSRQIKTIDKQFCNCGQLRTSVITNWLKIYGLRKTQYLAGHKHVTSTETYVSNNLENLIDDINKLHPFL
ncbi:MAG: tyrosine-type recombinase/integrase [Prevotellaceae bacterium]|jgi:site-specific recombinase XerD|nr:tyrosine-type recombinase/integrase [Prevotellaceae bacterium]